MPRFRPQFPDTLRNYDRSAFRKDLLAGIIVGIVALPLAIAFAIASGVSPEKGLVTAVIAGFLISALGGSRVQIGGPTGAFIGIVYGIVQIHGVTGLIIATFIAGVMLILMGVCRLGTVIQYIPHPLVVGFTTGIAFVIFSSQIKDALGLSMGAVPTDTGDKWIDYAQHLPSTNGYAVALTVSTIAIISYFPKITHKLPGSLIAIILTTAVAQGLDLPVETIGTRFGNISPNFPAPAIPSLDWHTIQHLIQPAFAIALLGGIESLLSAVVADGMTGQRHRSNTELTAQGIANIASSLFGGIPATGAIARTATSIKNGARTPVAGIIHAITLLLITLFAARWAALIPMATLAGILIVVAYNMSEWKHVVSTLKGPRSDALVLITTLLLTVLVDLTVAISIGMLLAMALFMRKMIQHTGVSPFIQENEAPITLPPGVAIFEVNGPLFFGAVYKFKEAVRLTGKPPLVLIIRLRGVPLIDATGIAALKALHRDTVAQGTCLILAEGQSAQVVSALQKSTLLGAQHVFTAPSLDKAIQLSNAWLAESQQLGEDK